MNDPWAAAKTATVVIGVALLGLGAVAGLYGMAVAIIHAAEWATTGRRQAVLWAGVFAGVWVVVFVATWCCGTPR